MPAPLSTDPVQVRLGVLRAELADLAYDLERRGQPAAADVAMMLRARLQEIATEPECAENANDVNLISL